MASSLYIHIPYCEAKCAYCDFNSYGGRSHEFEAYMDALERDLAASLPAGLDGPLHTVFVGGGTPSVVPGGRVARLLTVLHHEVGFAPDVEITTEANPGSLDEAFLEAVLAAGLTRLSLGVQSFDDGDLRRLGRVHDRETAVRAVAMARRCGVPSLSLDLIFGVPGQTVATWVENVRQAIALGPDHLSMYGLTIEEGTRFGRLYERGRLHVPPDDAQADMQACAVREARAAGFEQYEISNYARPGHECRHNLMYWDNGAYLGVGAGAVSYLGGWRWTRVRRPDVYIRRVRSGASLFAEGERVDGATALVESIFLGLRTTRGVDLERLSQRHRLAFPPDRTLAGVVRDLVRDLEALGHCHFEGDRLRLTAEGRMLSNGFMTRILDLPASLDKDAGRVLR